MARDYDPQTGRYVESDPIGLAAGVNTYGYALASPIGIFDRSGLVSAVDDAKAFHEFDPKYIPRVSRETKTYICETLKAAGFNLAAAHMLAYHQREQERWMNPVHESGENWLYSARPVDWVDRYSKADISVTLYQQLKVVLPISDSPFSVPALEAGLDGLRHYLQPPADLKKWCDSCELH